MHTRRWLGDVAASVPSAPRKVCALAEPGHSGTGGVVVGADRVIVYSGGGGVGWEMRGLWPAFLRRPANPLRLSCARESIPQCLLYIDYPCNICCDNKVCDLIVRPSHQMVCPTTIAPRAEQADSPSKPKPSKLIKSIRPASPAKSCVAVCGPKAKSAGPAVEEQRQSQSRQWRSAAPHAAASDHPSLPPQRGTP